MGDDAPAAGDSGSVAIRDAACVVVVDLEQPSPRILMGRRHADQIFLPNKWVFPGGRLDDDDRALAAELACPYAPQDLAAAIRPFVLAGIRELSEETGCIIGEKSPWPATPHAAWRPFAATGHVPTPHALTPLARAITPPGRVRRYDTWFFTAERKSIAEVAIEADGELLDLDWFDIGSARSLDIPSITRLVLEDAAVRLQEKPDFAGLNVPFYYAAHGAFERDVIASSLTPSLP